MPRAAPDDPHAEQEIRDGVCGHRVTKPAFVDDQTLINHAAENARNPFVVRQPENGRRQQERNREKPVERHG